MKGEKRLTTLIERHHDAMPRYVIVPSRILADWRLSGTTVVDAWVDQHALGRRTLKKWDENRWFIELPERFCKAHTLEIGERVDLELARVSEELPEELEAVLKRSQEARQAWACMSASRQRIIRESVIAGKQKVTREKRAAAALGVSNQ
jgi:hypothetical protein